MDENNETDNNSETEIQVNIPNNIIKNYTEWNDNTEDMINTWLNQISLNRKAHSKAKNRCIFGHYCILIPLALLTAANLIVSILSTEQFSKNGKITYNVFSILIAVFVAIFIGLDKIFNFELAKEAHTDTVREYDALKYEIQLILNLDRSDRRKLEPFMVFITQKFNQINMTKNPTFLWGYDDELASIGSVKWAAHNLGYNNNKIYIDPNTDSDTDKNNNEL